MSTLYVNVPQKHFKDLLSIAYKLEKVGYKKEGKLLGTIASEIIGSTLSSSLPSKNVLLDAVTLLRSQTIKFAVIGGMAVNVHGTPRGTSDIDMLVSSFPKKVDNESYMDNFSFYTAYRYGDFMKLKSKDGGEVDLLLAEKDPLFKIALSTAKEESLLTLRIPVVIPEVLVALKVKSLAEGNNRTNDLSDIVSIWTKNGLTLKKMEKFLAKRQLKALDLLLTIQK